MQATAAEAPSGKGAGDENFPVGSFLLPAAFRPHVATFYAFARTIDDVADDAGLDPEEKLRRLDGFDRALTGETDDPAYAKALRLRQVMAAAGISVQHGRDLISAFKQDAVKGRYKDWDELVDYCSRSAAPVGRFLLDLHGESRDDWVYADALCNALQIINHLQDCKDDYRNLDRVYLSTDWMTEEGTDVAALDAAAASPAMRRVLDRTIEATEGLMTTARRLPAVLQSRRLAMESGAIVCIADRLLERLRRQDPIATRVELSRPIFLISCLQGACKGVLR